jgi:hypothetical protein
LNDFAKIEDHNFVISIGVWIKCPAAERVAKPYFLF